MLSIEPTNEGLDKSKTVQLMVLAIKSLELLQTLFSEEISNLLPLVFILNFEVEVN